MVIHSPDLQEAALARLIAILLFQVPCAHPRIILVPDRMDSESDSSIATHSGSAHGHPDSGTSKNYMSDIHAVYIPHT